MPNDLGPPIPPTNVQVSYQEGERQLTVPAELLYVGMVDGAHRWEAVIPESVPLGPGLVVHCDTLPAKTAIALRVADDDADR